MRHSLVHVEVLGLDERDARDPDDADHGRGSLPSGGGKVNDHEADGVVATNNYLRVT